LLTVLEEIQLGSWYGILTKEHKVDYDSFLLLDKDDLKEMQVPIGVRKKLLLQIQKEKESTIKTTHRLKTKWEDSQRQLSVPKHFPLRTVEPILYSRLLDIKYRENFAEFLKLQLRYYGWSFIKLPQDMVEKLNEYKTIWNKIF